MLFITGDKHGDFSEVEYFCAHNQTTQERDTLIVLGDAGINYYLGSGKSDRKLKEELSKLPITLLMVRGNHEADPATLPTYQCIKPLDAHYANLYFEQDFLNQYFVGDGVFKLDYYNPNSKRVLICGGAYSIDKAYRLANHMPWFEDEQPSAETKARILESLVTKRGNNHFDYVFTHTCPLQYEPTETFFRSVDQSKVDKSTEKFLSEVHKRILFDKWYCGHYHTDKIVGKMRFMYHDFEMIKE